MNTLFQSKLNKDEKRPMSKDFGEALAENLPKRSSTSYYLTDTPKGTPSFRYIGDLSRLKKECSFKLKEEYTHSAFFKKSNFIIWRDVSVTPNVYYWERTSGREEPSNYKYGPFVEISETFAAIKEVYSFKMSDLERVE